MSPIYTQKPLEIAFALENAGQLKAMAPVMQILDERRVSYGLLAEGTAKRLISQNPNWSSHLMTAPWQVMMVKKLVTGLTAGFQHYWASLFTQAHKPVIGFYEGFSSQPLLRQLGAFSGNLSALMVPTLPMAQKVRHLMPWLTVHSLGQPALETTAQKMREANPVQLAKLLKLDLNRPLVLFIGDYGIAYEKSLRLLVQAAQQSSHTQYLIALHPASDGSVETQILRDSGFLSNISIAPKSFDSASLLALPGSVLTHQSNLALMAQVLGKAVVYLGQLENPFDESPNVVSGYANRVDTPESLLKALFQATPQPHLGIQLGIPGEATQKMADFLSPQKTMLAA